MHWQLKLTDAGHYWVKVFKLSALLLSMLVKVLTQALGTSLGVPVRRRPRAIARLWAPIRNRSSMRVQRALRGCIYGPGGTGWRKTSQDMCRPSNMRALFGCKLCLRGRLVRVTSPLQFKCSKRQVPTTVGQRKERLVGARLSDLCYSDDPTPRRPLCCK